MKAILELEKKLTEAGIPHEMEEMFGGYIIGYPDLSDDRKGDVICHRGSFGYKQDLLEAMGFGINPEDDGDDVVGYLTVEQAFEYFRKEHEKVNYSD